MNKKETFLCDNLQHQNQFLTLFLKTQNHFFQLPALYLNDQTSQLEALLLSETNSIVPTIRTWRMSRQILSKKESKKWVQNLKCSRKMTTKTFGSIQNPTTGETVCNIFMNLRNQLVIAAGKVVEEIVASADTIIVRRHRWRIQFDSLDEWPCGPSLQKDLCDSAAVQWEQDREFVGLNPTICKVETGRRNSNNMSMLIIDMKNLSVY